MHPHPVTGELFASPVPPGSGWPEDPFRSDPSVAASTTAAAVRGRALQGDLASLCSDVSICRACPRLVGWRERMAHEKRAAYRDQPYWGRPVPGWGATDPRIVIVGLAPAAHGANRTGRIFTGDRSGDWLFAALHRVGLATQSTSVHAADGLQLVGTRMIAAVRCAPPQNKPTTVERDTCAPWLDRELQLVSEQLTVVVALGSFGWSAALRAADRVGWEVPAPRPRFGHGSEVALTRCVGDRRVPITLLGCYHPSQQNTFTGRLTEPMLDAVLGRACELANLRSSMPAQTEREP